MSRNKTKQASNLIVFLENNQFMGFVERLGANEIVRSAKAAGLEVEVNSLDQYFNVICKREGGTS